MMNKIEIKKGDVYGNYTVVSDPFFEKKHRKVKCKCECGKIRKVYCGNIKRITSCTKCSAKQRYCKLKTGDKKYSLTFLNYFNDPTNRHTMAEFQCDCGNKTIIEAYLFGKNKTCGCIRQREGFINPSYQGCEFVSKTYFTTIKYNAIRKKRKFNLSIDYLNELLVKQNHKCAMSGLEIKVGSTKTETTASVDRINNKLGYIIGNVQWVHKDVNRMKSDFDSNYFKFLCSKIAT